MTGVKVIIYGLSTKHEVEMVDIHDQVPFLHIYGIEKELKPINGQTKRARLVSSYLQ